jgi:hypothetical protein
VLEKVETEFTSEIIDFYYCEWPRLTRLYLLCSGEDLGDLLRLLKIYQEFNPSFEPQSVKLICLITNILGNDELILEHPGVTFINNPEDIRSHQDILRYAHYADPQLHPFPADLFFYHHKYNTLELRLDTAFPGRFSPLPYAKLADVYPRIDKLQKQSKPGTMPRCYLLLP